MHNKLTGNPSSLAIGLGALSLFALAGSDPALASETNEQFCARIAPAGSSGWANCVRNLGGPTPVMNAPSSPANSPPPKVQYQGTVALSPESNERYCAGIASWGSAGWSNCVTNLEKMKPKQAAIQPFAPQKYASASPTYSQSPTQPATNFGSLTKNQLCKQMKAARKSKSVHFEAYIQELSRRGLTEKNCAVQWGKILAGIAVVGIVAAAAADGGGSGGYNSYAPQDYSFSWDEQNSPGLGRQWVCRGEQTGRYADLNKCGGKIKTDLRWPN